MSGILVDMKIRASILAAALALAGCGTVQSTYAPHSAVTPTQATTKALRFYEGDVATLGHAGAQILGRLELSGYAAYDRIREQAAIDVAQKGGTHFILDEDDVAQRLTDLAAGKQVPERTVAPFRSPSDTPIEEAIARKKVIYLVVRVAPEQWSKLPDKLRPAPLPTLAPASVPSDKGVVAGR